MTAKAKTLSAPQSAFMRGSWGDRFIIVAGADLHLHRLLAFWLRRVDFAEIGVERRLDHPLPAI